MNNREFNSITCLLEGINIIEASAGTGKTYNIQNLYARMILDRGYSVESILVVTFTEAATKELKDRIRTVLSQIKYNLLKNNTTLDDRIEKLLSSCSNISDEVKLYRVTSALRNFDNAAIFTIHGFCNRILNDFSFESSILFNLELEKNPDYIIQEIVEDFWRIENYNNYDKTTAILTKSSKENVKSLTEFIKSCIAQAKIRIEPRINPDNEIREFKRAYNGVLSSLNKQEIIPLLPEKHLNKKLYNGETLEKAFLEIEAMEYGIINQDTFKALNKFNIDTINLKKKKSSNFNIENHPFFLYCRELSEYENLPKKYSIYLKLTCYDYFVAEYKKRKTDLNIQTFDDLLNRVNELLGANKSPLLHAVRRKYNAAMIDEFQDTDPVQYNIFKNIFINAGKTIFLVGDPKQAIYAFRGGDIFTYQKAKNENRNGTFYNLNKNWRSADNLIKSINTIFLPNDNCSLPFADKNIDFYKVDYSGEHNSLLIDNKVDKTPLKLLYIDKKCPKEKLTRSCSKATAAEIADILSNENYELKENKHSGKILPSDIAVLVSTHKQAQMIKNDLTNLNIPAVLQATGSVFDSEEAEQLVFILEAIVDSNNANLINGVLLTDIFGYTPEDIENFTLDDNPEALEEYENILKTFVNLNDIWLNRSFIEMFNTMLSEFNIKTNLLSQINGERKLTNLLHLAEVIHDIATSSKPGMNGLISWLAKQRNKQMREDKDEFEIRLESDSNSVNIMTVHKSKGLEFPIVFCPFLWSKSAKSKKDIAKYHINDNLVLYLGDEDNNIINISHDENLFELIRLLYVAVTRAKYQCYISWGNLQNSSSALDYIFRMGETAAKLNTGEITENLETLTGKNSMPPDLSPLENSIEYKSILSGDISPEKHSMNNKESKTKLNFKEFNSLNIDTSWRISSFSSIAPHRSDITDQETFTYKDYDETDNETDLESEINSNDGMNIFNFPAGAKTGTCWHSIFEIIDFKAHDSEIMSAVKETLEMYGIIGTNDDTAELKQNITFKMVKNVLSTFLPGIDNFKLGALEVNDKLVELEFNFRINDKLDTKRLSELLKDYYLRFNVDLETAKWNESYLSGFMTGFIDLVFRVDGKYYIIDWKSNKLDGIPGSFKKEGLKKEIGKNFYFLQYLIYTVALNKYLSRTIKKYDYNKHFGGVYYIFLRGVSNKPDSVRGIFYDKPDKEFIAALTELF